jgi:hypothetical protein
VNKSEFITLVEHPENLEKVHIQALKGIITDFPYLQQAHSILTKALYSQKHYEFEKQLKNTALIVPDREVLYAYIHDIKAEKNAPAISVLPEVSIPVKTEDPVLIELPVEDAPANREVEKTEAIETLIPVTEETIQELTFLEWLQRSENQEAVTAEEVDVNTDDGKQILPESDAGIENNQIAEEIKESMARPVSNVHDFENILDKFIRENPSISRPKAEFYNPVNVAKQSVEEDEDLVTETLANIYYKQGHYKKAIRTYEKLCLIYPHKMAYFASLIQKIKTENKD